MPSPAGGGRAAIHHRRLTNATGYRVLDFDVQASSMAGTSRPLDWITVSLEIIFAAHETNEDDLTLARTLLFERRFCVSNKACDAIYGLESLFASSSTQRYLARLRCQLAVTSRNFCLRAEIGCERNNRLAIHLNKFQSFELFSARLFLRLFVCPNNRFASFFKEIWSTYQDNANQLNVHQRRFRVLAK